MNIIVSGANGQMGMELRALAPSYPNYNFHFFTRDGLDIANEKNLKEVFQKVNPNLFINCAAYTAVDKAEEEIEKCFLINDYAVGQIGELCKSYKCKMIHFSSDYVYHLEKDIPLSESDSTLPRGIYAQSKLAGEQSLIRSQCTYLIIRTSWVYSSYGKNFIKTVLRLSMDRDEMNVVKDQIGTLTYAHDLAKAILSIVSKDSISQWNDIYNYSNDGRSNWFEIAQFVTSTMNLSMKINPIPSSGYPTPADRPKWSLMSKEKFKAAFGIEIPDWKDSLKECLSLLSHQDTSIAE